MSLDREPGLEWECLQAEKVLESAKWRLDEARQKACVEHVEAACESAQSSLVRGRHRNPVHHTACVLDIMVEIMLGQPKTAGHLSVPPEHFRLGIWAAIFHDAGNAFEPEGEEKIRVKDVRQDASLLMPAMEQRRRHMDSGARLVEEAMNPLRNSLGFTADDIAKVGELVRHHDDPTLGEYFKGSSDIAEYLFVPAPHGRSSAPYPLSAFLREADRLWMLTTPGVVEDLRRNIAKGNAFDPPALIEDNRRRHCDERDLYEEYATAVGKSSPRQLMKQWGFGEDTAFYRSDVGKKKYQELPARNKTRPIDFWRTRVTPAGLTDA
jgi:hypothetical protein